MGGEPSVFNWRTFHEFKDYVDTVTSHDGFDCPSAKRGHLNHFEVTVSQKKIEVFVSPFSEDGVHFDTPELVLNQPVSLPIPVSSRYFSAAASASINSPANQRATHHEFGMIPVQGNRDCMRSFD